MTTLHKVGNDVIVVSCVTVNVNVSVNVNVQPRRLFIECPQPVNDGHWHTAYIKRRANLVEAYIDDCTHASSLSAFFKKFRFT